MTDGQRAVRGELPLLATADSDDYYMGRPIDITVGLWALLWSLLLPMVGIVLAVRAVAKGMRRRRWSVFWLGVASMLACVGSTAGYVYAFQRMSDDYTTVDATTLAVGERYTDEARYAYRIPEGMIVTEDGSMGTVFAGTAGADDATRQTGETYEVYETRIYPAELDKAVTSMRNRAASDHFLWWGRALQYNSADSFDVVVVTHVGSRYYIDVKLPESIGTDGYGLALDRMALVLQPVHGAVMAQVLHYNSMYGWRAIDETNSAWREMAESVRYVGADEENM